jgi:hypothetical protein
MNKLLLAGLLLSLSACKKDTKGPLSPTSGTWSLISSILVVYQNNGSSATTNKTIIPNAITLAFSGDGTVKRMDKSLTGGGSSSSYYYTIGTYTLTNGVITTSYPGINYNGTLYPEASTLFTNNSLTLVHTEQGANSSAVTTDTYTR